VDVSAKAIAGLRTRVADEQLANVEVIEGTADDPKLPPGTLDAALIVNAYHEMDEHQAMLARIKAALKPEGRLVIVEPISALRRDAARADQVRSHEIAVDQVQQEAREAGFKIVALQDPFTSRRSGQDEEWLLVLTPAKAAPALTAPPAEHTHDENAEWKKPELRIGVDEFKKLLAASAVVVVDVRDDESYKAGHIPGAILVTGEDVAEGNGAERLRNERRPIVTYCS
jgi:SAM-dependent methyltransferase